MASSESNTFEEESTPATATSATATTNMPIESSSNELLMETEKELTNNNIDNNNINQQANRTRQRHASYRGIRLSECPNDEENSSPEDSWWSEVENNDLLLDQVPNVTAVFTPTPEAILEKSISLAESESVLKEDNFDRLHKIADKIKMTLNEHAKNKEIEEREEAERERKLSESSEKEQKHENCTNVGSSLPLSKEQSLEEFKEELRSKRLLRQNAVQDMRDEIASLKRQLALEREVNRRLRKGEQVDESSLYSTLETANPEDGACAVVSEVQLDQEDPSSSRRHANIELANAQLALQMANSENINLRGELAVVQKQVVTLKEVIACCKQMLAVKEEQCNEIFR